MCGICGIYNFGSLASVDASAVKSMCDSILHRGPDDSGIFVDGPIGLGHRRLSIIDISDGHQPMFNEDRTAAIVFNGEIYNYQDLRPDLEHRGHHFASHSDTEVIIHAYEEYGEGCVDLLRGMFAFAIWDARKHALFVARDRLGVKPFYYTVQESGFIFGSEIKAILANRIVRPSLNEAVLPHYFSNRFAPIGETFFQGIHRLPPGCYGWVKRDGLKISEYWDLPVGDGFSDNATHSFNEQRAVSEFSHLFEESVRLRLMSDVPLGMFLSGGIDSSAICAAMSGMADQRIKTFSVGFAERSANEFHYARLVSDAFATDHHEVQITPEDFFTVLPRMIWHEDEPIAHPSSIPLYYVSQLAKQHVTVVLTGEGSDELLGGYYRYPKTIMNLQLGSIYAKAFPETLRQAIREGLVARSSTHRLFYKLSRTFLARCPDIESLYFDNFAVFHAMELRQLFVNDHIMDIDPYNELTAFWNTHSDQRDLLQRMLYADIKTYLVELLMKQDQMSMAASIESRVPFLDHRLVEFAFGLPSHLKIRHFKTKYLLRQAMKGRLPVEIISRPKMGFPVPLAQWFRGQFAAFPERLLCNERFRERLIFRDDYILRLLNEHRSGMRSNADRLWLLMNFEIWCRIFLDGEHYDDISGLCACSERS